MLIPDVNLKSYSDTSYHNEELKSLTRHRFDKDTAIKSRKSVSTSISSNMPAKSLQPKHTITLIQ